MRGFAFLLSLVLLTSLSSAQLGAIEVKVIDKLDGAPVYGVNAVLSDKKTGVSVGMDGKGRIDRLFPHTDTLFVHSIGYHRLAIPLLIKTDTLTLVEVKLPVGEFDVSKPYLCVPEPKKLPRKYVKKNTKITYVPINKHN